jgi:hypothetical protein
MVATPAFSAPPDPSPDLGRKARQKIERIENQQLQPGESMVLTEDELNAALRFEYGPDVPPGIREPKVELLDGFAIVRALVDIAELQRASDGGVGLWGMVFGGERALAARVRPSSAGGRARVLVESVTIDDATISGSLLEYLLAAVFEAPESSGSSADRLVLPGNLRELKIEPARAVVVSY